MPPVYDGWLFTQVYFRAVNQEPLEVGGGLEGVMQDLNNHCHVKTDTKDRQEFVRSGA